MAKELSSERSRTDPLNWLPGNSSDDITLLSMHPMLMRIMEIKIVSCRKYVLILQIMAQITEFRTSEKGNTDCRFLLISVSLC